jgi:hypothetical protein
MIVAALALLAPLTIIAQTTTMTQSYTWAAPTTGAPVHHYEVQKSTDNGTTWIDVGTVTTGSATLTLPVLVSVIIRVRAVDATSRVGVWSPVSDPYLPDPGPPGACGKPSRV